MKHLRWSIIALLLLLSPFAVSQQTIKMTQVTAQVQDTYGNLYAGCQWSVVLVPGPGGATTPAQVLGGQQGQCDSKGNLSVSLADNNLTISPGGSQWSFSICSTATPTPGVVGPLCKTNILVTVTGTSMSLTTTLKTLMPSLLVPEPFIINYNSLPVTGNGISSVQASSGAVVIGSAASIAATSLCSTTQCPAGRYLVHVYIDITTACTTTGTTIPWLGYTDDAGAKAGSSTTTYFSSGGGLGVTPATASAGLILVPVSTTDFLTATYFLDTTGAASSSLGSINYGITNTACGSGGPMVGNAYFDVTRLE